jgi:uncharacterized protein YhbP (UPF0306 family)
VSTGVSDEYRKRSRLVRRAGCPTLIGDGRPALEPCPSGPTGDGGVMPAEQSSQPVDEAQLRVVAGSLLDASTLCSIATVAPAGRPHINTAYFAPSGSFDVIWLSDPDAEHSRNLRANAAVAVAVYDSGQVWGQPDRGIQLFGLGAELAGLDAREAAGAYSRRFPAFDAGTYGGYRLYRCRVERLKLFDERIFGTATFVTARVGAEGRPFWERTEAYRPNI